MTQYGLALSGGGFRACVYHLGVIRFLRDSGQLRQVSHITSVSGGSVFGAHLVLNWDRYCGSEEEFRSAAGELLSFMQLDVRNRIVRRFPLTALWNFTRQTLRLGARRQFTRVGLLENHYRDHLYGDLALFELPESPRFFMLSTNLSEGAACAFHRDGLLLQRRGRGGSQLQPVKTGLATVAMAAAASSAFPGFFPPLILRAADVGAREGEFGRLGFTDGGIYDNLGLRMFHELQNSHFLKATESGNGRLELDRIFVSDAGASFKVRSEARSRGLLSTAMRSTDILMDRVNQLEQETFRGSTNVSFFPITQVVPQSEDPFAPHEEVQRQAALIRTDMDQFSDLELSVLARHGYCVARNVIRKELPEIEACDGPAWDPIHQSVDAKALGESEALASARRLQRSSSRRIFSTLLNLSDWPTYVWVPLLAFLLFTLPYLLHNSNETAIHRGYVLSAIAETSPIYGKMLSLIDDGPVTELPAVPYAKRDIMEPMRLNGFEVLSDNRIYDLRSWETATQTPGMGPYVHSRIHIRRTEESTTDAIVRIHSESSDASMSMVCRTPILRPKYSRMMLPGGRYRWEIELDFSRIPPGGDIEVEFDGMLMSESAEQSTEDGRFQFSIFANTGLAQIWMLMPENRDFQDFEITGSPIDEPNVVERIDPADTVKLPIGSIATFQLINPRHDYRYECRWEWRDE